MLERTMSPGRSVSPERHSELKRSAAIDQSQIRSSSKRPIPASPRYANGFSASTRSHWGQVVVFPPGTLQVHHKEMDSVPAMNPPGTLQIHFEFPTQFTSDDPSWDMHSTLTVFQLM